jgi:hypothetical protein
VATLPALAGESSAAVSVCGASPSDDELTDEQRRIAAVIKRYGPELGSGR